MLVSFGLTSHLPNASRASDLKAPTKNNKASLNQDLLQCFSSVYSVPSWWFKRFFALLKIKRILNAQKVNRALRYTQRTQNNCLGKID